MWSGAGGPLGRQQADQARREQHVRVHPRVVLVEQRARVPPRALQQPRRAARVEALVGRHVVHLCAAGASRKCWPGLPGMAAHGRGTPPGWERWYGVARKPASVGCVTAGRACSLAAPRPAALTACGRWTAGRPTDKAGSCHNKPPAPRVRSTVLPHTAARMTRSCSTQSLIARQARS